MDGYAWLPLAALLAPLGIGPDSDKARDVEAARVAAADEVQHLRPDLPWGAGYVPPPRIVQGAVMWAARLYARRSSPTGLVTFGEYGAVTTPSFDADAERLLGVGRYAAPQVG